MLLNLSEDTSKTFVFTFPQSKTAVVTHERSWSEAIVCFCGVLSLFVAPAGLRGQSNDDTTIKLNTLDVVNIVRRSYQYVAIYNLYSKWALGRGWNTILFSGRLADQNNRTVPRPNNDTLYLNALIDLRKDPVIMEIPAIDSKYVSMMTSAYDHYVEIPMSTTFGDFTKPSRVLFYTKHTEGYRGEPIEGVNLVCEMTGDFVSVTLRAMPHLPEPARAESIRSQLGGVTLKTLSQFRGKSAKKIDDVHFPAFGRTNADIFGTNLLDVMQFVFNHTIFDPDNDMDRALLAAYKPLGPEPGKTWDPDKAPKIDSAFFRQVVQDVERGLRLPDPSKLFMPKGQIDLTTEVFQSVLGPLGQPAHPALYLAPLTNGVLNARNDYVIRMTKDELPPAKAFWSFTLYDAKNGFFIPNSRQKYSVRENTGYKLNDEGGIEIHVAAEQPKGVPDENWLPINRGDERLELEIRIYAADMEKMKAWKRPIVEILKRP